MSAQMPPNSNKLIDRSTVSREEGGHAIQMILKNFRRSTSIITKMQHRERQILQLRKALLSNKVRYLDFESGMSDLAFQ